MEGRRSGLAASLKTLERALFPHFCQGCAAEGPILCADCRTDVVARLAGIFVCPACGEPSPFGRRCPRPSCGRRSRLDGIVSMAAYRHPVLRKLLHAFKYDGVEEAGEDLASFFGMFIESKRDMLVSVLGGASAVAVPSNVLRRAVRGFDPCAPFLSLLAARTGLVVPSSPLYRKFRMKTQVSIGADELRRQNAAGSVVCRKPVTGRFVIVDDVVTTGATLEACAGALKAAGASEVWAVTVLKG